jgi:tRNA pseudouridine38-40 synthase
VLTAEWRREERSGDWRFEIEADRFLHGMVRAVVGTLVAVGRGRWDVGYVAEVLASRDRRRAGAAAPPHGLVLERVDYAGTPHTGVANGRETRDPSDG